MTHQAMSTEELLREQIREDAYNFLEIGRGLREFYDNIPVRSGRLRALDGVLAGSGLARRTAIHWIIIARVYSEFEIPYERLVDIGWAKLSVMARHVDRSSIEKWLSLAENNSVQSLKAKVKGCPPATRRRSPGGCSRPATATPHRPWPAWRRSPASIGSSIR